MSLRGTVGALLAFLFAIFGGADYPTNCLAEAAVDSARPSRPARRAQAPAEAAIHADRVVAFKKTDQTTLSLYIFFPGGESAERTETGYRVLFRGRFRLGHTQAVRATLPLSQSAWHGRHHCRVPREKSAWHDASGIFSGRQVGRALDPTARTGAGRRSPQAGSRWVVGRGDDRGGLRGGPRR